MLKRGDIILFQGDSITDCDRLREENRSLGQGYANLLGSGLLCDHADLGLKVYNRGISGDTVMNMYARFEVDCYMLKPTLLSILIGVNDVWREMKVENSGIVKEKYEKVYDMLLTETAERLPQVRFVLLEPFVLQGGLVVKYQPFRESLDERRRIVQNLAKKHGAIFVPLQDAFDEACKIAEDTHWLYDGVHPTAAGHGLIAKNWKKAVFSL